MYPTFIKNAFVKKTPKFNQYILSFSSNGRHSMTTVNDSAGTILSLCDGKHSFDEIVSEISQKYDDDYNKIQKMVLDFIKIFIDAGVIKDNTDRVNQKGCGIIKGSEDVYLPSMISWELTDYCPLKCQHCYLGKKNNKTASMDDIQKVLAVIDLSGVYQVQLTGGEALTHPNIGYIIHTLIERGITVGVSTSGYYFTNKIFEDLQALKKVYGSRVRVSLDGQENKHNFVRGKDDAYRRTVEFIKKLIEREIPCQIETCLIDQSEKEIEELVCFVKHLGVNSMEIGMLLNSGSAKDNNLKSIWDSHSFENLLRKLNNKYADNMFHIRNIEKAKKKNCGAGYILCHIDAKMNIKPCPMLDIVLGNLNNEDIIQIMKKWGKVFCDFEFPQKKYCESCEQKDVCKHCTAAGLCNHNNVAECKWYRYAKETLEITD